MPMTTIDALRHLKTRAWKRRRGLRGEMDRPAVPYR